MVLVGPLLLAPAPVQIKTGKNVTVVAARLATLKAANPLASREAEPAGLVEPDMASELAVEALGPETGVQDTCEGQPDRAQTSTDPVARASEAK